MKTRLVLKIAVLNAFLISLSSLPLSCGERSGTAVTVSKNVPQGLPVSNHYSSDYNPFAPVRKVAHPTPEGISTYPGLEVGSYKLVAVNSEHQPISLSSAEVSLNVAGGPSPSVEIALSKEWEGNLLLYLFYPQEELFVQEVSQSAEFASDEDVLFFSSARVPGVIGLAVITLPGRATSSIQARKVASIAFTTAPVRHRTVSVPPTKQRNQVDDLTATINPDGTVFLGWTERHIGDYSNDGGVNIQDVTPVAEMFFQTRETTSNPGRFEIVDGNGDGVINIQDMTPLAENFFTVITGYSVYRTLLTSPDEDPDPEEASRWQRIPREGAEPPDAPPTVVRQFNNQDFRLPYTLNDVPPEPGFYAYFVRPFSRPEDNPNEGIISVVAKTQEPAGQAELFLTVANADGRGDPPIFSVGEDVILKVHIENAFGVFSSNVRFLYRSDVLELLEDFPNRPVPSLDGYEPNLLFDADFGGDPLFLGLDVGDAGPDGYANYRWSAMNATKRAPAPTASGSGALAYFRFRVIAGGDEPVTTIENAFRFPQSSVFIYLMAEEYGVLLPAPIFSDSETIAVSTL